jgi:hypothetical protein
MIFEQVLDLDVVILRDNPTVALYEITKIYAQSDENYNVLITMSMRLRLIFLSVTALTAEFCLDWKYPSALLTCLG